MTQEKPSTSQKSSPLRKPVARRAALKRLGLAASVAYLAPTLATIKSASAQGSKSKTKSRPSRSY